MGVTSLVNGVCSKRLVPRFLYHITTVPVYEKICQNKIMAPDEYSIDPLRGIFMLDLQNFFKRWNFHNKCGHCFQRDLLYYLRYKAKDGDLVMVRVPTENLDRKNLLVRSLQRSFGVKGRQDVHHHVCGSPANWAKFYTKKREPLEYIYQGTIPEFQKIGQANSKLVHNGSIPEIREFFLELLKGTKEAIGADKFIVYNFIK